MPGHATMSVWPSSQIPVMQSAISPHVRSGLQSAFVVHGMPPMRSGGGSVRGQPATSVDPSSKIASDARFTPRR